VAIENNINLAQAMAPEYFQDRLGVRINLRSMMIDENGHVLSVALAIRILILNSWDINSFGIGNIRMAIIIKKKKLMLVTLI